MGGIYSGKSLISHNNKDTKKIINQKNGTELNVWKGNISEYNSLKNKKNNIFYLINTPLEQCLNENNYNIDGIINEDIYEFIDRKIQSFTPDISFRATLKDNTTKEYDYEILFAQSYENIYNKYLNNETITGAGLRIDPFEYYAYANTQLYLNTYEYLGNSFKFIFAPTIYHGYSLEMNKSLYVQFCIIIDADNNITASYELI